MTNISKANRAKLAAEYEIGCAEFSDAQYSVDGTIKYLFPTRSGKFVETVYIPDKDRATLCVSSQVGCKMNCLFCQTGKQGFEGSLPAGDILNQIYSLPEVDKLTNIVFMGQGEPMDNLDNVLRATEILTADYGWAWSSKRITVSSVGVKNKLKRFLEESECHVAISMHDPIPSERAELMPAERGMSIEQVVELLKNYDFSHQRRLSFEYIVFKGVNDSMQHAKAIIKLVKGLDCRFNLIRFHQIPDIPLQGVNDEKMEQFRDYLTSHGVFTTIRASRGQDIYAACGLLSTSKRSEKSDIMRMRSRKRRCRENNIMVRKTITFLFPFYLIFFLLTSCDITGKNRKKPASTGQPYEVVLEGDTDSIVTKMLTEDVTGLPQPEPLCRLIQVKRERHRETICSSEPESSLISESGTSPSG